MAGGVFPLLLLCFLSLFLLPAAAEDLIINGELEFVGDRPAKLPPGSEYLVQLSFVLMDAPSVVISAFRDSAEKLNEGKPLNFQLRLPEEERGSSRGRHLAVSAVVNVGWSSSSSSSSSQGSSEWIRRGDYKNVFMNLLEVPKDKNTIDGLKIEIEQYK
ncbi:hypothetical protein, conserved [Eimeria tenella]|uniref:Uncharacterized protein n=1 Tax=Eimeria tenella TaxID=5802 RepID=U6KR24_EIMTE|nr:hypothetical protein, conserved [Eimeria tenella]CDJ39388.1 hypothetical protein, conserved [Eimeria tenella]|eukprot:XP_013230143.1 hypothetical protein, conserved [Eimeria tenella]